MKNTIYVEGMSVSQELFTAAEQGTRLIRYDDIYKSTPTLINSLINSFDIFYVSFVAHNIDRYMSTIICQFNESYTQQSQRYVEVTEEAVVNECFKELQPILGNHLFNDMETFLINRVIPFYKKVTAVDEGKKRGGRDKDQYIYGIPIEDARYVLPLLVHTTVDMTISFPRLFELYKLAQMETKLNWGCGFRKLWDAIVSELPGTVNEFINVVLHNEPYKQWLLSAPCDSIRTMSIGVDERLFSVQSTKEATRRLTISEDYNTSAGLNSLCTAAYSSTKACVNTKDVKAMNAEDKQKVIDRVTGYGHTSIEEHHQGLIKYSMSLSCYHQFLRHRIPTNRVNWKIFDKYSSIHKAVYIPSSIEHSEFYTEYIEIMAHYRDTYYAVINRLTQTLHMSEGAARMIATRLAPNAAMIEVYSRSNLRADKWINRERLCMTASSEIRHLMAERYLRLIDKDSFYEDAVPPCFLGKPCKEGGMHCKFLGDIVKARTDGATVADLVKKFSLHDGEE